MIWRDLFGRRKDDVDIEEEIESHLQLAVQDRIERGQSPQEARRAALLEFGSVRLVKEDTQAVWSWTALEQLIDDLRTGSRILARSPGLSATAVALIALVIGGNAHSRSTTAATRCMAVSCPRTTSTRWACIR
jgi:hypothetical protein